MADHGSLVLVHGAGSGPWIFDAWRNDFPDLTVVAVDLQEGLEVSKASMNDYAQSVVRAASSLSAPLHLCGWSMGGLVALMAAEALRPDDLILLEPSPPAEVQGRDDPASLRTGTFDPEDVYGMFPADMRARPESQLARDERKRGISVPSICCPCLVLWGEEFPEGRGKVVAEFYGADHVYVSGAGHWDLVTKPEARDHVREWIEHLGM